jgi:hypothetical protein
MNGSDYFLKSQRENYGASRKKADAKRLNERSEMLRSSRGIGGRQTTNKLYYACIVHCLPETFSRIL